MQFYAITSSKSLIYEFSINGFTKLVNNILIAKRKAKLMLVCTDNFGSGNSESM